MKIEQGLLDSMVLQRTKQNVCDVTIHGQAKAAGVLEARVTSGKTVVRGFNWKPIGRVQGKKLQARLSGLKVGGPYDIQLRVVNHNDDVVDEAVSKNILVGDVWILGGQSNMQGCARMPGIKGRPTVRAYYMHDVWGQAKDPIHNLFQSNAPIHTDLNGGLPHQRDPNVGVGPGVAFGLSMEDRTGIPQGLIASAHGGTSMDQWDPKKKNLGGRSLYGATIERFEKNGGRCAGIIWYQGCSDATAMEAPKYTKRMKTLVSAFRRDLRDPKLPFVLVQISRVVASSDEAAWALWNSIQEQQRLLPRVIDRCLTVPAIDLELDDCIHIDTAGQHRLGRRLAETMCVLTKQGGKEIPPIELKSCRVFREPNYPNASIELTFANVAGSLQACGIPNGFMLTDWAGKAKDSIFKTLLRGNRILLRTIYPEHAVKEMRLHYGCGVNPYANIVDAKDRSLPVFGPIPLGPAGIAIPPIQMFRVSALLPSAGKLETLSCPDTKDDALGWESRMFPADFANRRSELLEASPQDVLIHYACKFKCVEAMNLKLELGYDGPVKLWLDSKELFHDPNGTNPVFPTDTMLSISPEAGDHELVVSLGSNYGKAWGVFLKLIPTKKIPPALIKAGKWDTLLPRILG